MRKILLTASTVALLGIVTPALAQSTTDPNAAAPTVTQPGAATAPAEIMPKFLGQQAQGQWLPSNLIGSSVYGPNDENLGDVNDIVLAQDGSPYALIIGVGGFLGIGEKNVAVSFSALTTTTDADGKLKLSLDTTKEELDAAPAFQTTAMLLDQQLNGAASTDAVPAAPAAPAAPAQ
jgi:hypothetical protein